LESQKRKEKEEKEAEVSITTFFGEIRDRENLMSSARLQLFFNAKLNLRQFLSHLRANVSMQIYIWPG
jgi:hypothetical protein